MRFRTVLRFLVLSAVIGGLVAAVPEETTVANKTAKKPASKAAAKKAKVPANPGPKPAAPKAPSKKNASKTASQLAAIRRTSQQHPTPERYQEIQQALADRGYFSGPADGNWGQDSVDALKRFQHDENLTEDGKIGSLSLIALGLGPKHDAAPAGSPPNPDKTSEKTDP